MCALHSATCRFAASAAMLLAVVSVAWPSASAPARTALQLELRAVDGGSRYYDGFSSSLPVTPSFFPIGIWFQGVASSAEVEQDRGVGINLYVVLTDNSDLGVVGAAGAAAAVEPGQFPNDESSSRPGSETRAWFLGDEIDMQHGAGWRPCGMPDSGYSCMQEARDGADDGRLGIANYGKGVTFWESDRDAATFVNRFQDVVSADNYWFTDPNICRSSEGGRLTRRWATRPPTGRMPSCVELRRDRRQDSFPRRAAGQQAGLGVRRTGASVHRRLGAQDQAV